MKKILTPLIFSLATAAAFAQGTVNFLNNSTTLISVFSQPPPTGWPGTYYFALLTAPLGTTDPSQFTFSGLYATNLNVAGIIFGGNGRTVAGWIPGTSRSFMVAGWTADAGHDWNPTWLQPFPGGEFHGSGFGISMIGSGFAGGIEPITGGPIPPLNIFGATPSIDRGFTVIPEPGAGALAFLVTACLLARSGKKSRSITTLFHPNIQTDR